jgi:lantibiotic leader peptide-processing serine protease
VALQLREQSVDPPEARIEQRTVVAAMTRALRYAHDKGVTLVASIGNNHEDLGHPRTDVMSPDFPPGGARARPIDNDTCSAMPLEGPDVIGVSALGPSGLKADYSSYGVERTSVAAPGGWADDLLGTPRHGANENKILSTEPRNVLEARGDVAADGTITSQGATKGVQEA